MNEMDKDLLKGNAETVDRAINLGCPYVFCHMEMSLDGKIMGRFWNVLGDLTESPFADVAFGPDRVWDHQGWLSGRVTTDDNFTHYAAVLGKLMQHFGVSCVMLGGGAALNWSMIQQGLCDEVSVIVDPSADGSRETQTLFMQADGLSTTDPVRFDLWSAKRVGTGGQQVWLRYGLS